MCVFFKGFISHGIHHFSSFVEYFIAFSSHLTPPKINIERKNDGLEDDFPLQLGVFSGS